MGRRAKDNIIRERGVQQGLTEDFTRATVIVKVETLEKVKDYAYTQRISIKEAMSDLLDIAIAHEEARLNEKGIALIKRGEGKH